MAYEAKPGFLRSDFSVEQSNALIDRVLEAAEDYLPGSKVTRAPSDFNRSRIDNGVIRDNSFEVVATYFPPASGSKAKVVAEVKPIPGATPDQAKQAGLESAVQAALRRK